MDELRVVCDDQYCYIQRKDQTWRDVIVLSRENAVHLATMIDREVFRCIVSRELPQEKTMTVTDEGNPIRKEVIE